MMHTGRDERREQLEPTHGRIDLRSADLMAALTSLLRVQKHGRLIRLSFGDGDLELVCASTSVRVPASGTWPTEAAVRAMDFKKIIRLRESLPESVALVGTDSHLHFSHYAVSCSWLSSGKQSAK